METHQDRVARTRAAYKEARDRFVARLRGAPDDDVHRAPADGGWSAAQIGWHVAAVDASFAAVLSGDSAAAKPIDPGAGVRTWSEILSTIPDRIDAGPRVTPPAGVRRDEVLASLEQSARKFDAALASLPETRATAFAITHPVLGAVPLAAVGDWAVAHVARHNAQAKRVLASVAATGR